MTGPNPIATIRETLNAGSPAFMDGRSTRAKAALTEVEHQLDWWKSDATNMQRERDELRARAVAAETALAASRNELENYRELERLLEAAEQRANELQAHVERLENSIEGGWRARYDRKLVGRIAELENALRPFSEMEEFDAELMKQVPKHPAARAALDRQEQT